MNITLGRNYLFNHKDGPGRHDPYEDTVVVPLTFVGDDDTIEVMLHDGAKGLVFSSELSEVPS